MGMLCLKVLDIKTSMTLVTTLSYLQRGRAGGRGRADARTRGRCYSMPPHTAEYMSRDSHFSFRLLRSTYGTTCDP